MKPKKATLETDLHKVKKQISEKKKKNVKDVAHDKAEEYLKPFSEVHAPRGERADFLKITLTIPSDLLTELRALGMKRKAAKMKDTDTSALIREALVDFLNKHKSD
jgi:transcriptional regulator of met regulon